MTARHGFVFITLAAVAMSVHGMPIQEFHIARGYLLIGQSNMEGFGCILDLPNADPSLVGPQERVFISSRTDCFLGPPTPSWERLEAGVNSNLCYPGYFGPEVSLGPALRDHFNKPIYLVKYGFGNTFLTSPMQNPAIPAAISWHPEDGGLLAGMMAHLEAARDALPANLSLNLDGIFWVQGAHDSGNCTNAQSYEGNLRLFIETLRGALVAGGFTLDPELPFIMSQVPEYLPAILGSGRLVDTVRCAEQKVTCTVPEVGIHDPLDAKPNSDDQCAQEDDIHMDAQSQVDHGRGLFEAFLDRSCPALSIEDCSVLATDVGGSTQFTLSSPAHPGSEFYLLGSESGISPGIQVGIGTIPLVYGPYFDDTLQPTPTYLQGASNTLDASGKATVTFMLPAGDPLPFGERLHHAFVVLDNNGSITEISNPISLRLHQNSCP